MLAGKIINSLIITFNHPRKMNGSIKTLEKILENDISVAADIPDIYPSILHKTGLVF